jgi:hypothetical protein
MRAWKTNLATREFCNQVFELYGPERKHLLLGKIHVLCRTCVSIIQLMFVNLQACGRSFLTQTCLNLRASSRVLVLAVGQVPMCSLAPPFLTGRKLAFAFWYVFHSIVLISTDTSWAVYHTRIPEKAQSLINMMKSLIGYRTALQIWGLALMLPLRTIFKTTTWTRVRDDGVEDCFSSLGSQSVNLAGHSGIKGIHCNRSPSSQWFIVDDWISISLFDYLPKLSSPFFKCFQLLLWYWVPIFQCILQLVMDISKWVCDLILIIHLRCIQLVQKASC